MRGNILDIEKAYGAYDKQTIGGICLLSTSSKQPTKTGSYFYGGVLSTGKGQIGYKVWSNSEAYNTLESSDLTGKVVYLAGTVNEYQGIKSIIINQIRTVTEETLKEMGVTENDFLYSKYDSDDYWNAFTSLIKKNVSEEAYKCFEAMIGEYEDAFKYEFAAISHHDNCKGGLLAHSFKVCSLAVVLRLYPEILKRVSKDLLYVGCALHDIGKLDEYCRGSISETGRQFSHMFCGGARVLEKEELIEKLKGKEFMEGLISIMVGHHGEFGDPPRTVAAYVVHKLDLFDATFTSLNELLEKNSGVVQYEGFILS